MYFEKCDIMGVTYSLKMLFFGEISGAAARGNRRFWPNPRTLPEPNDPARFGYFGAESVTGWSRLILISFLFVLFQLLFKVLLIIALSLQ